MKKILYIFIIFTFLTNCSKSDNYIPEVDAPLNSCMGQNLGINELGKFSKLVFDGNSQTVVYSYSPRWMWSVHNDTIEVGGEMFLNNKELQRHLFFKKTDSCIEYLFTRDVWYNSAIFDPITFLPIEPNYTWVNYKTWTFKLQEYKKDKFLIGQAKDTKFWCDLTADVHRTFPYDYEQFYHD